MLSMRTMLVVAAVTLICFGATAQADLVVNGDFETATEGDHAPPWTLNAGIGAVAVEQGDDPGNADNWCLAVRGDAYGRQRTIDITANQNYAISFDTRAYEVPAGCQVQALLFYRDDSNAAHDLAYNNVTFTDGNWHNYTLNWTSQAGESYIGKPLQVQFQSLYGGWSIVDNVVGSVTSTPEPGTLVLVALGVLSLLCYAWRKRK
jgi:hypothetical protein